MGDKTQFELKNMTRARLLNKLSNMYLDDLSSLANDFLHEDSAKKRS